LNWKSVRDFSPPPTQTGNKSRQAFPDRRLSPSVIFD
jgi:hypothetical protein